MSARTACSHPATDECSRLILNAQLHICQQGADPMLGRATVETNWHLGTAGFMLGIWRGQREASAHGRRAKDQISVRTA